jgi:surface antigen
VPSPSAPTAAARAVRVLVVSVIALAALVLPATPALATPPGTPPAAPGQPGEPGEPGAGQPGEQKPDKPEVWTGYPGTNTAHDTYGYPWPAAPDCNEASIGSGCVNDGLGFFQGQCTSWVAFRVGQRNGVAFSNWYAGVHWGNASEWAKVAKGVDIAANKVPATGAIGWYARGHVSYVESVNTDGSIVISEMNIDGHNGFVVHTVYPGDASWPDKFIHVADVVPVDYTAPEAPGSPSADTVGGGVRLDWDRAADDLGTTGYTVRRDGIEVAQTATPGWTDRTASPGQPYTYTVTAHDAAGNVSAASTARVDLGRPAPARLATPYLPGTAERVSIDGATVVCGLRGGPRDQRVGCTRRTTRGPELVRAGREVGWGSETSRRFVAGRDGKVWFCRDVAVAQDRSAHACLPFDLETRSWGFDRIDHSRAPMAGQTWLATPTGPAVCGTVGDRATCSVVDEDGWREPKRAEGALPGDPLSRAFVPTADGLAFCRVVSGRAACAELGARGGWERDVLAGRSVAHGRWVTGETGPELLAATGRGRVGVEVDPVLRPDRRALVHRLS